MRTEVYINNRMNDLYGTTYVLYSLLRSFDDTGRGVVKVHLDILKAILNRSEGTVRHHLKRGDGLGFYHYLKVKDKQVTVRYKAWRALAVDFDLAFTRQESMLNKGRHYTDNGHSLNNKVPLDLYVNYPKFVSTWSETTGRTRRHYNKLKRLPHKRVNDPMNGKQLLAYEGLSSCDRAELHNRTVVLPTPNIINVGASQASIATYLGRTRATINKRLRRLIPTLNLNDYYRVFKRYPLAALHESSVLDGVLDTLLEEGHYGKYRLLTNYLVLESSTCMYPMEDIWAGPGVCMGVQGLVVDGRLLTQEP